MFYELPIAKMLQFEKKSPQWKNPANLFVDWRGFIPFTMYDIAGNHTGITFQWQVI